MFLCGSALCDDVQHHYLCITEASHVSSVVYTLRKAINVQRMIMRRRKLDSERLPASQSDYQLYSCRVCVCAWTTIVTHINHV